jgi:hypothetical protein
MSVIWDGLTTDKPLLSENQILPAGSETTDWLRFTPSGALETIGLAILTNIDCLHNAYAPCSLDTLRNKGYHYWALGHVHNRQILCGDPYIVFRETFRDAMAKSPAKRVASW